MGSTPNPINPNNVGRLVIAGTLVSVLIIGLFLGSWFLLGSLGVDTFFRLVISICLPPMLLLVVFGVYILLKQSQTPPTEQ